MCGSRALVGHLGPVQSGIVQHFLAVQRPPGQPPPQETIRALLGAGIASDASQFWGSFGVAFVALPLAELPALDLRELLDAKAVEVANNFGSTVRFASCSMRRPSNLRITLVRLSA